MKASSRSLPDSPVDAEGAVVLPFELEREEAVVEGETAVSGESPGETALAEGETAGLVPRLTEGFLCSPGAFWPVVAPLPMMEGFFPRVRGPATETPPPEDVILRLPGAGVESLLSGMGVLTLEGAWLGTVLIVVLLLRTSSIGVGSGIAFGLRSRSVIRAAASGTTATEWRLFLAGRVGLSRGGISTDSS